MKVDVAVPVCAKLRSEMEPVKVEVPAPVTESEGVERAPFVAMDVVPVEPNAAVFPRNVEAKRDVVVAEVPVALVKVSPPLKAICVVVALPTNK